MQVDSNKEVKRVELIGHETRSLMNSGNGELQNACDSLTAVHEDIIATAVAKIHALDTEDGEVYLHRLIAATIKSTVNVSALLERREAAGSPPDAMRAAA
jgi:hypothetical protein